MMRLGVDPGLTGALALVTPDEELAKVWDMPTQAKTHGKGNEVNAYLLADILDDALSMANEAGERLGMILEQVNAMPAAPAKPGQPRRGMGATSAFNFGEGFGVIRGVAASMGIKVYRVRPERWKRQAGLIKKPKDAALALVVETWPEHRALFARKKDVGRADAALIGLFGRAEVEVRYADSI